MNKPFDDTGRTSSKPETRREALRALGALGAGALWATATGAGEARTDGTGEAGSDEPAGPPDGWQRQVPVLLEADVVVVGGGAAGVCAAISAARAGARVVLVERWPMLGGLGTMGGVNTWHTSNLKEELGFGLTQEFIEALKRYDGVDRHPRFPHVHGTYSFSPYWLQLVLDEFVRRHKVRTLCYTTLVDAVVRGGSIEGVVVATKRGLRTIRGARFIDASGSGDLGFAAGCPTVVGRPSDSKVQGMTMVTMWDDLDPSRRDEIVRAHREIAELASEKIAAGELPPMGPFSFGLNFQWRWRCSLSAIATGDPLEEEDLTRATMEARANVHRIRTFYREHYPGLEDLRLDFMGSTLGVRESRRVLGQYVFDADDVLERRSFSDAIGHGFWMIDIHDPGGTGHTTWSDRSRHLQPGETYQIPYRMLLARGVDNLLLAGRCASATHQGMAALRIQTHCHLMGQAAGYAAAMSLAQNASVAEVDVGRLQRRLIDGGVHLDRRRVEAADAPAADGPG